MNNYKNVKLYYIVSFKYQIYIFCDFTEFNIKRKFLENNKIYNLLL